MWYPFAIHESQALPFTVSIIRNTVTLHSTLCARTGSQNRATGTYSACSFCLRLRDENTVVGMLHCALDGAHEKTPNKYLSISHLLDKASRQRERLDRQRFQLLNVARKFSNCARHLDNWKRLVFAVSDARIPRINALLAAARKNGSGVVAMLDLVDKAARHVYRARQYGEPDFQRTFPLWKLGGVAAANIAYRTLGLPSIDAASRHIMTNPVRASAYMPTLSEAQENLTAVLATFAPRARVVLPVSMPIDEIKCQERLRWDCNRNLILGVCREHCGGCALEFRSIVQADDLALRIQSGEVHMASEVRVLLSFSMCPNVLTARVGNCRSGLNPQQ